MLRSLHTFFHTSLWLQEIIKKHNDIHDIRINIYKSIMAYEVALDAIRHINRCMPYKLHAQQASRLSILNVYIIWYICIFICYVIYIHCRGKPLRYIIGVITTSPLSTQPYIYVPAHRTWFRYRGSFSVHGTFDLACHLIMESCRCIE